MQEVTFSFFWDLQVDAGGNIALNITVKFVSLRIIWFFILGEPFWGYLTQSVSFVITTYIVNICQQVFNKDKSQASSKSITDILEEALLETIVYVTIWAIHLSSCVCYIFSSLFCMSKREDLWNKEKWISLRKLYSFLR